MKSWTLDVKETSDGDKYIEFNDDIIAETGWKEGDVLEWDVRGSGIILTKVNDASGYEVIEE